MTTNEWFGEGARRINANWPHQQVPNAALAKWYDDLKDLALEQVLAGIEALYRDGEKFPPNGAQILAKVVELAVDAPDWEEVLRWLRRYVRTGVADPFYYQSNYVTADPERHPARVAERLKRRMPPLVADFIDAAGDRQITEAFEQQGGGEARLREKWATFVSRRRREATYLGLPDSGLATLERVNNSPEYRELVKQTLRSMPQLGRAE